MTKEKIEQHLSQAQLLIDKQQPQKALDLLVNSPQPTKQEDLPRLTLLLAWAHKDLNNTLLEKALLELSLVITEPPSPDHAQALHFLGMCEIALDNSTQANELLAQSVVEYEQLQLFGAVAFGYIRLAEIHTKTKQFDQAHKHIDKARKKWQKDKPFKHLGFLAHIFKSAAGIYKAQGNLPPFIFNASLALGISILTQGPLPTLAYLKRRLKK